MKNFKWGTESFSEAPINVVLFVSRNKDNANVENFTERRMSFITHKSGDTLKDDFLDFVNRGVPGEMSRMYISVNERDGKKIYTQLMHFLFDNPDFNLCSINSKLAGIAAQKECALARKWMFDFDSTDVNLLQEFLETISEQEKDIYMSVYGTPHGYAVVTSRGFDCRELLEKFDFVTLKRDDLLCVDWRTKE